MKHSPSGSGPLLTAEGDARITPFGKWLRKSKVDELPQLINVLLGDMSLVGSRPEVPRYVGEYTDRQKKILLLKPGITGPSANVYEEQLLRGHLDKETFYLTTLLPAKLEIDIAYCESVSFTEDVKLIIQTFWKIFMSLYENDGVSIRSLDLRLRRGAPTVRATHARRSHTYSLQRHGGQQYGES